MNNCVSNLGNERGHESQEFVTQLFFGSAYSFGLRDTTQVDILC